MAATLTPAVPNGPDTKNGYTFLYLNIPLVFISAVIIAFRVWWRCIRNGGGALNKSDICVVICLVTACLLELGLVDANLPTDIQCYSSGLHLIR
jgi:hypothetical protein